jgi:putative Mg2+ transporter-C (MgtC) family protein
MEARMGEWSIPAEALQVGNQLDYAVRMAIAVLLGGIIGLERELRDKPAGFRTIILICLGACVFTMMSEIAGGPDWQRTRIAAQIVTGIGFLGAGAILRDRQTVVGLTTAATIWAIAAVGMVVGFGLHLIAFCATMLILLTLFVFDYVEHGIGNRRDIQDYEIVTANDDDSVERLKKRFKEARLKIRKLRFHESDNSLVFTIIAMGSKSKHEQLRIQFARAKEFTLRRS